MKASVAPAPDTAPTRPRCMGQHLRSGGGLGLGHLAGSLWANLRRRTNPSGVVLRELEHALAEAEAAHRSAASECAR